MKDKTYPAKSYLSTEKRDALRSSGVSLSSICVSEAGAARDAGDTDTAWAWFAAAKLPTPTLKLVKLWYGSDFIRKWNFDTTNADRDLGAGWLEKPDE
ncbi:MAG: hypothetical protein Q4A74_08730 [Cardiobacteriaceae bacterium]|nr:hypothetical protein [Cardiobacteriaceae bacterium]